MSQLVLFTNGYPFGNGETFIGNEITYLSKSFSKVLIVSIFDNTIINAESRISTDIRNIEIVKCPTPHHKILYRVLGLRFLFSYIKIEKPKKMLSSLFVIGRLRYSFIKIKKSINSFIVEDTISYSYWLTLSPLSIWAKERNKKIMKCISRAHGHDLYTEMHPWNFEPIKRKCLSEIDTIYPCSEYGCQYIEKKYNIVKKNINMFLSKLGTNDYGKKDYIINEYTTTFVTCSTNAPVKNIPFFAKAFSTLSKRNQKINWCCIGFEPNEEIKMILNNNNAHKNCIFTGKLSNCDVINYYINHNITYFVNVSKSEGIPVSIMEAQSFGIPVIASNVGGTSEIVDNNNGFLFDANISIDDFVNLLEKAINISENEYRLKRELSRKTWEEKSSADKNYTEFIKMIKG